MCQKRKNCQCEGGCTVCRCEQEEKTRSSLQLTLIDPSQDPLTAIDQESEKKEEVKTWKCESCGNVIEENEESPCENCNLCSECCTCQECKYCSRLFSDDERDHSDEWCSNCECCRRCCSRRNNCFYCNGCDEYHSCDDSSQCDNCERCNDRCECCYCKSCENNVHSSDYCSNCDRCSECCECNSDSDQDYDGMFFKLNPSFKRDRKYKGFRINSSQRMIGIEIETSKVDCGGILRDTVYNLQGSIVHDGSIEGVEINLAPRSGDLFISDLKKVCNALSNDNAKVDSTCGLHVHIEAKDLTYYDLRKVIKLYTLVEPSLFNICSKSRQHNHYCQRGYGKSLPTRFFGRTKKSFENTRKDIIGSIYYGSVSTKDRRSEKYSGLRYGAINLNSWFYRGTIEFRLLHGSLNHEKISNFAMILASLIDTANSMSEREIDQLDKEDHEGNLFICIDKAQKNEQTRQGLKTWFKNRKEHFGHNNENSVNVGNGYKAINNASFGH